MYPPGLGVYCQGSNYYVEKDYKTMSLMVFCFVYFIYSQGLGRGGIAKKKQRQSCENSITSSI